MANSFKIYVTNFKLNKWQIFLQKIQHFVFALLGSVRPHTHTYMYIYKKAI